MRVLQPSSMLNSPTALTNDQLARIAPSIFATHAHDSRSDRYTYLPTSIILDGLRREGFEAFGVAQSRCRDVGKREFTKHMLRMRHVRDLRGPVSTGDEVPEVVVINAHDGSSSWQMMAGMFRYVCANGLVIPSSLCEDIRIPHTGDVLGRVLEGAFTVVKEFDNVREHSQRMKAIDLSPSEQNAFAAAALMAKYDEPAPGATLPITITQALLPRRREDTGADLWSTFNRVQENLVKGGQRGYATTGRRTRTRPVAGISQNVALNRALWTLGEEMAKLKQAA